MGLSSRCRILLSCGEPSGDLYGAELVRHLRADIPELEAFGLGGDRLAEQGLQAIAHVRELAVMGLVEVVAHVRRLRRIFRQVLDAVDREPPRAAVLIDYPDFNLRLARELHRRGIPIVYYVSPQVWAWRRGRIRTIRETVARMVVIFPFEEELYRAAGVPVTFVGHPLVELVRPPADRGAFVASAGLDPSRPVVALLPGSRPQEITHNLPPLLGAVEQLRQARPDLQFAVAIAPSLDPAIIECRLRGLPVAAVRHQTQALVGSAALALVASGTATVETALLDTPMVVVYRLSPVTYALGRPFVRVPHFAMVNLIAGRQVVPELIQRDFTAERVTAEALRLLDPASARTMKAALAEVRQRLGPPGASARAAGATQSFLKAKNI
jgi:lipid-A-disaccharide synthase